MKVQRRCDPKEVYEVMEESATHYIIDRGCNDIALRKKDYEPVEEWVDVTNECHISESGGHSMFIMHKGCWVGTAAACSGLYRLKATGSHGIRVERKKA